MKTTKGNLSYGSIVTFKTKPYSFIRPIDGENVDVPSYIKTGKVLESSIGERHINNEVSIYISSMINRSYTNIIFVNIISIDDNINGKTLQELF